MPGKLDASAGDNCADLLTRELSAYLHIRHARNNTLIRPLSSAEQTVRIQQQDRVNGVKEAVWKDLRRLELETEGKTDKATGKAERDRQLKDPVRGK